MMKVRELTEMSDCLQEYQESKFAYAKVQRIRRELTGSSHKKDEHIPAWFLYLCMHVTEFAWGLLRQQYWEVQ